MQYVFNEYLLDTDLFELRKSGCSLHAEPQVIELLILLVESRDRLVSKEEINDKIWRGRVVSEAALSSRIKMARQLLGDDGRNQNVIRTVHKKGFRFVAPVECLEGAAAVPGQPLVLQTDLHEPQSKPAIAVLPFVNLSNDAEQEYFSDGITSDIITYLSKHRWLSVTARNTTFGFKGKALDLRTLGDQLSVDYIVEGSVQRMGQRVRITVSLVDASSGLNQWSERYDKGVVDIFALQDEITEKIAARLEPEIGFAERSKVYQHRPANLHAWDCYHLAIYHFFKFTSEDNLEAQRLLQESLQRDENFGEAYAWWAYAVVLGMIYWQTPPTPELLDQALRACNQALSLDGQNATFYSLRGRVLLARREYDSAVRDNETAIGLNPSFAAAHCGLGDSLAYEGRNEEAAACFEKAIDLSPNDPQRWAFLSYGALNYIFKQDYRNALQWAQKAARIPNCQYWAIAHQVVALSYLQEEKSAHELMAVLLKDNPEFSVAFVEEKLFYLKKPEQISLYINGLRKAGVPEYSGFSQW
ncbi:MAG: winged helix-turn-helix domain-containing protein [Gammaproteobacteria bacterium]|nr:winged helix-turn-helix domain-containing protein [Gammaproteobacteria bacterium]